MAMDRTAAETLALQALTALAGDAQALERLLRTSGMSITDLYRKAGDAAVLGGILDHLLADEAELERICRLADIAPETVARARAALPGAQGEAST